MNKIALIASLILIVSTFAVLWVTQGEAPASHSHKADAEHSGEALIGGAFSLTDQEGRARSDLDFRGQAMLVFFGFTHCPDICPVTVATFSSLMGILGDKAAQVAPVFITVDPKRDTPEAMKTYLSNFDRRIVGLSGSEYELKKAADAYKVYYSERPEKTADADAHAGHDMGAGDADYMVDHSGYIYLMSPEGKYVQHFPYNASEQELLDALKPFLK